MVALGPYWESTDPNAPAPRVTRAVRGFGAGFNNHKPADSLYWAVKAICRAAGLDDYNDDWLVGQVIADCLGHAAFAVTDELRDYVEHMVKAERRKLRRERNAA